MGLPENIDALLVKYDITPSTLAKIAGVSTATVSRWRTGSTTIRSEKEVNPASIMKMHKIGFPVA